MLYGVIQWSTFVGFLCILVAAPFTFFVARLLFVLRKRLVRCADGRINILSEVVNGMRVIKYYAWEKAFKERVEVIRNKEVGIIWESQKVSAMFGVALFSTPVFIAVCSLGSFSLAGNTLTASKAYTALALFNMLRFPLILIPLLLSTLLNALSAIERLGAFLLQDESAAVTPDMSDPGRVTLAGATFAWPSVGGMAEEKKKEAQADQKDADFLAGKNKGKSAAAAAKAAEDAVAAREAAAAAAKAAEGIEVAVGAEEPEQAPFELADIDLDLAPGSLTMIIGRVGSGKSSLLSALNAFVPQKAGHLKLSGHVAYVAQSAWILNSTVRDNILFGVPYDAKKYQKCLEASQLATDLEILPGGDQTMIGERGVTLSGGQKQRVAIARAVYAAADVYLLDDPLSAVDNHVVGRCRLTR